MISEVANTGCKIILKKMTVHDGPQKKRGGPEKRVGLGVQ
jgi:hypothetical protein